MDKIHIATGREMCHAIWDDDFAKVIELAKNGDGDITTIKITNKDIDIFKNNDYAILVTKKQMDIINKLEKII
jgi:general stress protein 26